MILQLSLYVFIGVSVCGRGGWGWGWGEAGGLMPLPTHPQQYCDPASLVITCKYFLCIFSRGHTTTPCCVGRSVGQLFKLQSVFALPCLHNHPHLPCHVSGLVFSFARHFFCFMTDLRSQKLLELKDFGR